MDEVSPHTYRPDYGAMGDCKVCGRLEHDPIHDPNQREHQMDEKKLDAEGKAAEANPPPFDIYYTALLNSMANAANPKLLEMPSYTEASVDRKLEMVAQAVQNQRAEIDLLRGDSQVSKGDLHAVADTLMEELEGRTMALIRHIEAEDGAESDEVKAWRERFEPWRDAWRNVLAMGPGRAGFMSSVNVVRSIREKAIYCVVALDRLAALPDVKMSNVAKNDFGLVLDEIARGIGGQDSVQYCHEYVAEKGEDKPPKEG